MKMLKRVLLASLCVSAIVASVSADYLKNEKDGKYLRIKGKTVTCVESRKAATNFTIKNAPNPKKLVGSNWYHVRIGKKYLGCTTAGALVVQESPVVWSTPVHPKYLDNLNSCGITLIREKAGHKK